MYECPEETSGHFFILTPAGIDHNSFLVNDIDYV